MKKGGLGEGESGFGLRSQGLTISGGLAESAGNSPGGDVVLDIQRYLIPYGQESMT